MLCRLRPICRASAPWLIARASRISAKNSPGGITALESRRMGRLLIVRTHFLDDRHGVVGFKGQDEAVTTGESNGVLASTVLRQRVEVQLRNIVEVFLGRRLG